MKNSIKFLKALGEIDDKYLYEKNVQRNNEMKINISNFKLKYILAPAFILVTIIAVIMCNNTKSINQQIIGNNNSISDIFTLKVYSAEKENTYLTENYNIETEEKILEPKVELLLASFNPTMSSVPGLPFKIELNNANNLEDEILITTDSGKICTWNKETGEVKAKGKSTSITNTCTLYWTPDFEESGNNSTKYEQNIWKESDIKTIAKIEISVQKNDAVLYENVVYIGEKNYNYYAILY